MSYYLDQLLDAQRRAECEAHDCRRQPAPIGAPGLDRPAGGLHSVDTETQRIEQVPGSALQWVRFTCVPWRTDRVARPVADRRGPRASRWGDLR